MSKGIEVYGSEDASGIELVRPLPGKFGQMLKESLEDGENVEVSLHPISGGAFAVTDKRVIIMKAGLQGGGAAGMGLWGQFIASFAFDLLSAVELRIGLVGGHLQLIAPGIDDAG